MKKTTLISIVIISYFALVKAEAQTLDKNKKYMVTTVGFYNLENLFDTIIDPDTNKILQDDFTPKGKKHWIGKQYREKIGNMSKVIKDIGIESNPAGLALLGVAEVENRAVLEDLVKHPNIKGRNYQIVHYESPDKRGIDVALLYQEKYFKVNSSKTFTVKMENPNFKTRDQLLVSGKLMGEPVHIIVDHWPSRRGGTKLSNPKRAAAADVSKMIIDSLTKADPKTKIILMGDLNDDPVSKSLTKHLMSVGKLKKVVPGTMYNTLEDLYKKGTGTLGYNDAWNLFDQILVSPAMVNNTYETLQFYKAFVYNKEYLIAKTGKYKSYPHRTFSFGEYVGGYSDHFPTYIVLIKEIK